MTTVYINGKEYRAEEGTPLKALLSEYGFGFPCGGTGKCGKCRIRCAELEPTDKDRRFLSENALQEGWRIACDKKVGAFSLTCDPPTRPSKVRELTSCNISVVIGAKEIAVSILDDEIAETVTVLNPLYGDGLSGLFEEYENDRKGCTKRLRAVLSKESIELFEKYGKAKAETFAIATNGLFAKILLGVGLEEEIDDYNEKTDENCLGLPAESLYFLPVVDTFIGGDLLAQTIKYPENNVLLDCGEICSIIRIGKEDNVAFSMWDMQYDEIGLKALKAALETLREEGTTPAVRLYGEYAEKTEDFLLEEGLTYYFCEKNPSDVAQVIGGLRYRTKLLKEKGRTSVTNLLNSEKFHNIFAE